GNLAYSVSNDDLQELFSQVGQVQTATVIMDKFLGTIERLRFCRDEDCGGSGRRDTSGQRFQPQRPEHQSERSQTARVQLRRRQLRSKRWWRCRSRPQPLVNAKAPRIAFCYDAPIARSRATLEGALDTSSNRIASWSSTASRISFYQENAWINAKENVPA